MRVLCKIRFFYSVHLFVFGSSDANHKFIFAYKTVLSIEKVHINVMLEFCQTVYFNNKMLVFVQCILLDRAHDEI